MQVMEAAARSEPSQPPTAELVGLQFGLATPAEFLGFSVLESRSKDQLTSLVDPRLGIPAEDERCATCGGTNYDECTGHFAHLKLTQPIFHPNHMRLVQRTLQRICLACGVPKVKKKFFNEETVKRKQRPRDIASGDANGKREPPVVVEADPIKKDANGRVITLSSDDEEEKNTRDILRVANGPMDFSIGSTSESGLAELPRLRSHKYKDKAHANGSSHAEATVASKKKSVSAKSRSTKGLGKTFKGAPASLDVPIADTCRTARSSKTSTCPHCSPAYPDYRSILVKTFPVKGRKDDVSELLLLEVSGADKDMFDLPDDFWAFIKGAQDEESVVPKRHVLTASEALAILKKIPESAIGKLGMNEFVARPESLIMKCVPVPPNCTRTTDYTYVNNTTAVRFGTDRVTKTLQSLLTEINRIHKTRGGKAMQRAQRDESKALQILTAEYLREKGAPKAVSGKEPLKKDRNGRFKKQDDHRWTKDWLTQNILGKGGNFTARAVVAGDPSLRIEEIGVPWEISQRLTIPDRATQLNCTKLQEYVDRTQNLQESGKPGAMRIERNGEAFQVWAKSTHKVQIGDVVHRNIQDGDYVYANRPPSVHKHSLMALKVCVHFGLVLTVNPLICPPLNADFDGDIFHLFIPQSLQAIAELDQLVAVPRQIFPDHGGHEFFGITQEAAQPILGLTQDTLLAAHLLTTSKLLVDKALMDQLCIWSSKQPPEPAIVRSPRGGPFWTGEQVFEMTLPADLELGSAGEPVFIQGGQIIKWNDGTKMLRKDNNGIASALCVQLGPAALVDFLNTATGLLHAWLQAEGFSTGLTDFRVTNNLEQRQEMLTSIFQEYYQRSIQESCNAVHILDAKAKVVDPDMRSSPDGLSKNVKVLEQAAQHIFRKRESDVEDIVLQYAEKGNSLFQMVKSGSKGSRGKLLQQIAGMGLQLYKGMHLLPNTGSRRASMSNLSVLDWWEDKGLVRSSLVDGLKAPELFNHVIADRTFILRKHLEVVQPGTLFKSLMLFLRDLHVMYDGSVRSQCGKNLVQFCYGGALGVSRKAVAVERSTWKTSCPTAPTEGRIVWEEDDLQRWPKSALAGEPVGILAATAVSQPAYEVMMDAPSLDGPFKPRPLELVQETLYPREKSDMKPIDRCVILRLINCQCPEPHCLEKRVLSVQTFLKPIALKTVAQSSAIEFWNMEDFGLAGEDGEDLRLGSPWLGHIKLSRDVIKQDQVDVKELLSRLRQKFSGSIKNPKKSPMGQIFFCHSEHCDVSNGECLHFSPRLPSKMQNQRNEEIYNRALQALLMKIQATIIPGLLESTVKGNEELESVRIVSEGSSWTSWHGEFANNPDLNEELVLEIIVSPKSKRSMAWHAVKDACVELMDMVDWNRSMPYSVQEIRHALGVEVAYQTVNRRLSLVLEKTAPNTPPVHVKLIADMMTFSGAANGFTFSGFQDMNKSTGVSAPFTEASVQKPIRTLLDAAGRGATDSVEGVMASCVFGKEAPLGTGGNFGLFWQPSKKFAPSKKAAEKDIHMIWKDLDEICIPDQVIPPSPIHLPPGLGILPTGDVDLDDGAAFSPRNDADDTWGSSPGNDNGDGGAWGSSPANNNGDGGAWGSSPANNNGDDGAWGSSHQNNTGDDDGWGISPAARKDDGGWGAVGAAGDDIGSWDEVAVKGQGEKRKSAEGSGWGSATEKRVATGNAWDNNGEEDGGGGWGSVTEKRVATGNAWDDNGEADGGGWGSVTEKRVATGNAWDDNVDKDGGGGGTAISTGNDDGWGSLSNEKGISKNNQNEDAGGGWGRGDAERSDEGGWGVVDDGSRKGTDGGDWGANPAQESRDAGWDSVATEVVEDDGWNSLAISQAESSRSDGAEKNLSHARGEKSWGSQGGGRGRGRGGFERGRGSSTGIPVSGANEQPLGIRRGKIPWGDAGNTQQSSSWDDVTTSTNPPPARDGGWGEPPSDRPNEPSKPSVQDTYPDSPVEWGALISGTDAAVDGWDAIPPEKHDDTNTRSGGDGDWADRHGNTLRNGPRSEPTSDRRGSVGGRERFPPSGAPPRTFKQVEIEPELKEIDDIVKSTRQILRNQKNETGGRLCDQDDEAVQAVLKYHPRFSEKAGCGIAYIKVDNSPDFPDVRCFWVVRTDGSEVDFSYRKSLREKVVKELPSFVDRYDELYFRKDRPPPAKPAAADQVADASTLKETDTQVDTDPQALPVEEAAD